MFGQKALRQYVVLAEELNFRRAAERLHMTQPPLTQSLQRLEAAIGLRLMDRSRSGVRLTAAGAALLEQARLLLAQTEKAIDAARRAEDGFTASLRVSFVPSVGLHMLPAITQDFRKRLPGAHLELTAQTSSQQLEGLRRGVTDVGIVVAGADQTASSDLSLRMLTTAGICAALPAGHRLAQRRRLRLSDLAGESFVLLSASQSPAFMGSIYAACSRAGFFPRVVQEASPIQNVLAMVACGVGISLVPDAASRTGHDAVQFVRLWGPSQPSYELSAVWLKAKESPTLLAFVDIAQARSQASGS